jgi:hypothetical protein
MAPPTDPMAPPTDPMAPPTDPMASQQPKKRRRAMTEADRRAVRRWKQANPKAIYEDIIKWFDQEFHHKIGQ